MPIVDPEAMAAARATAEALYAEAAKRPGAQGAYGRMAKFRFAYDDWLVAEVESGQTRKADILEAFVKTVGPMIAACAGTCDLPQQGVVILLAQINAAAFVAAEDDSPNIIPIHDAGRQ